MNWFQVGIRSGSPLISGPRRLTPRSLVVAIRWPFMGGGLIFNHPIAVNVQTADGPEQTLPIIDITWLAQAAIFGLGLLVVSILGRNIHD